MTARAEGSRQRLRVASYNVHAFVGTDGRFAPDRIAAVLRQVDADLVALQEVEDRLYKGMPVSNWLARELGLVAIPGPTLKRGDADYGNLVLSRHDPVAVATHDLSVAGREPRGAIAMDIVIGQHRIRLVATHFGLTNRERRRQLQRLEPVLESEGANLVVLCADLNEWWPWAAVHRQLGAWLERLGSPNTFPSRLPLFALDRIYASPGQATTRLSTVANSATRRASDHLPVVADFDLRCL